MYNVWRKSTDVLYIVKKTILRFQYKYPFWGHLRSYTISVWTAGEERNLNRPIRTRCICIFKIYPLIGQKQLKNRFHYLIERVCKIQIRNYVNILHYNRVLNKPRNGFCEVRIGSTSHCRVWMLSQDRLQ